MVDLQRLFGTPLFVSTGSPCQVDLPTAVTAPPAINLSSPDSAVASPQTWFTATKSRLGSITPLTVKQLVDEFGYANQESNEALANSDFFLNYLTERLQTPFNFQSYTNPNTKIYSEVLPKLQQTIKANGLTITHQSDEHNFGTSKSIAILIADTHDDQNLQLKTTNLMLDLYSGDIPLSSGFVEGEYKPTASGKYKSTNSFSIKALLEEGYNPEQITMTILQNTNNPALSFQPESKNIINSLKRIIKDLVVFEMGFTAYKTDIERDRNHFRKLLASYFSHFHSNSKQFGYEYFTGLCLLVRKILDKETDFSDTFKQGLYDKFFKSFFMYNATLEPGCPTALISRFRAEDLQTIEHLRNQITSNSSLQKTVYELALSAEQEAKQERITRNQNIAKAFIQAEQGTRIMSLGANHVNDRSSGSSNVRQLLEQAGFAVVVVA